MPSRIYLPGEIPQELKGVTTELLTNLHVAVRRYGKPRVLGYPIGAGVGIFETLWLDHPQSKIVVFLSGTDGSSVMSVGFKSKDTEELIEIHPPDPAKDVIGWDVRVTADDIKGLLHLVNLRAKREGN